MKYLTVVLMLFTVFVSFAQETDEPDVVSMVYLPYLGSGFIDIGIEEGYFAEQNIEFEKVLFTRTSEATLPFINGEIDVLAGLVDSQMVNMLYRAEDLKVVASTTQINPDAECSPYGIFTAADRLDSFQSPADLAGKTFWSIGDQVIFWYSKLLEQGDLTVDDIELSTLPPSAVVEGVVEGAIDFIWAGQPNKARYLEDERLAMYVDPLEFLPVMQVQVLFFGPNMLENEDLGNRFMTATLKSLRQFNEGPTDRNVEIMADAFELEPEFLKNMCWQTRTEDGSVELTSTADFIEWAFEQGSIDEKIDFMDYYDTSFIEYANEALAAEEESED